MKKLQLSIIIPVYNENENILNTLKEIRKHIRIEHEVLIVYDSDNDTTIPIVKPILKKNPHIQVTKNIVMRGPSGAIRTGIAKAKGSRVLVTMADLCDDLSQVEELLQLVPDIADIACPSRYMRGGKQHLKYTPKVFAPRAAGIFLKFFAGIPTYDPTNSYKMYSKKMLDKIQLKSTISFSVTLEIVVKAHSLGYKIVEIPTVWRDRIHGKSNFKFGKSLIVYMPWFLFAVFRRKI
jgi:dolichol-phosphate mannosyltransferase